MQMKRKKTTKVSSGDISLGEVAKKVAIGWGMEKVEKKRS